MAVLSIQSHVVYGYAGNTAAVFPLQRLGREVWAINTVEFSNHTGYGAWRGKVLGAELSADLVTGLEERGVLKRCEAVLSGYLGDADVAMSIADAVKKARKESPNAIYACDPVMGDVGRGFYVKPDIPGIFKKELIPLADIITPNQFELNAITGMNTQNMDDTLKAVKLLHEMGPSIVLVTSYREKDGELSMIASDKNETYKITTPELPLDSGVAGTGDMTAAVFLSRYLETKDLKKTLELCTASVFGILEASFKTADKKSGALIELKIIDNQKELVSPSYSFKAEKI
ncbi:MAG: pyridoxal kinase PdxY [Treponema sp.]|jgi:pyridoxine kinase|nr:pyridoxal kinase PdxY [Treponema sp.]